MKIEQLRYIIEIANLNSITKAAEKLFVSQPNISHSVKLLESELGFKIFERSNNGTTLTESGQLFYNKAKKVVYLFDELSTISSASEQQILSISSYPFTAVSKTYAEFIEQNSGQEIILHEKCSISACIQDVYAQKSEIAFIGYITEHEKMLVDYLRQYALNFTPIISGQQLYAYTSVANGITEQEEMDVDELAPFTRFRLEDKNDCLGVILNSEVIPKGHAIYTHSLHNLIEIEKKVKGYAIGIDSRFQNSNPDAQIKRIRIRDVDVKFLFGYVTRRDWTLTKSARSFINLLSLNIK